MTNFYPATLPVDNVERQNFVVMQMSLAYAIMGLLSYRPMTGYNLKEVFDNSVNHFWHAHLSQIYRELARMEEQGLVVSQIRQQEGKPDRKVYSLTPAGEEKFLAWLQNFPPRLALRYNDEFLLRIYFAGRMPVREVLYQLIRYQKEVQAKLENFMALIAVVENYSRYVNRPQDKLYWLMTLELGIELMQTNLRWAGRAIEKLESMLADEKSAGKE